uniref:Uncharacterized protein n=1 Tax=Anguilla anguilla TaxID=7936 RepID=A0A0E9QHE8_ANGAN
MNNFYITKPNRFHNWKKNDRCLKELSLFELCANIGEAQQTQNMELLTTELEKCRKEE